jgi:hypothetical protein
MLFFEEDRRPADARASGQGRRPENEESSGDGEPDEAAALTAEAAELAAQARRHKLDMFNFLHRMAQLEVEERLRLRSRRNLS